MKKNRLLALLISLSVTFTVGTVLTSCERASVVNSSEYELTLENVFISIQELGYTGTYDEFVEAIKGEKGADGNGIESVELSDDYELIIKFTDGTTVNLGVVKGDDGFVGEEGKSAYQIYCEYYPDYKGTEKEWIDAIATGTLVFKVNVEFDTDGGDELVAVEANYRQNLLEVLSSYNGTKENYRFAGWTYADGGEIGLNDIVPATGVKVKASYIGDDVAFLVLYNGVSNSHAYRVTLNYGDNLLQALQALDLYKGATVVWEHTDGTEIKADEIVTKAEGLQYVNAKVTNNTVTLTLKDGGVSYDGAVISNSLDSDVVWYYNGEPLEGELSEKTFSGLYNSSASASMVTGTRYGYTFKGWYYEDGTEYDGTLPESDSTVYARWTQNGTLVVMYDENQKDVVKAYILETLRETDDPSIKNYGVIDYKAPEGKALEGWKFMGRETATENGYTATSSKLYVKDQFGMYYSGGFYFGFTSVSTLTDTGEKYFSVGNNNLEADGSVKKAVYKFYASLWDEKYSILYYDVNASGYVEVSGNFINDGVLETITAEEITIPATCQGLPVVIQNGTQSTNKEGFDSVNTLKKVTIEAGVKEIGSWSFQNCIALEEVVFEGDSQMEVIGHYAFRGCTALKKIDLPASVKLIGAQAFADAFAEDAELVFDFGNVTATYGGTFYKAHGKSITVNGMKNIVDAIGSVYAVTETYNYATPVTGPSSNILTYFENKWNNPEDSSNYGYKSGTVGFFAESEFETIVIGEGTEYIGSYAFQGCTNEKFGVVLPDSVKTLGRGICKNSTICEFESNATAISDEAFYGCTALVSYSGSNYTSIGANAFYGCTSLNVIRIPAQMESIDASAFAGCSNITNVTCSSENTHYSYDRTTKFLISLDTKSIVIHADPNATEIVLPEGIEGLGEFYKGNTSITKVTLSKTLTQIDDHAFEGCTSLKEIVFPTYADGETATLTKIGSYAFNKSGLTSISVPAYVEEIGEYAFANTASLEELVLEKDSEITCIPSRFLYASSVKYIYLNGKEDKGESKITQVCSYAFGNSKSIKTLDWGGVPQKDGEGEYIYKMSWADALFSSTSIDLTLPANLNEIVFNSLTGVKSLTYPEGLQIKYLPYTFLFGYVGTSFVLPACVEQIGETSGANHSWSSSKITSFTAEEGSNLKVLGYNALSYLLGANSTLDLTNCTKLEKVDNNAFASCKMTTLKLPGNITTWGRGDELVKNETAKPTASKVFSSNTTLATVIIDEKTIEDNGTAELDWLFTGITSITTVTLPEGTTRIGKGSFAGLVKSKTAALKTINIPSTVTEIADYAFYCASAANANQVLTKITLSEGLKTIGKAAFAKVYLTSVTIPSTVTTIGDYAFYLNEKITSVTLADNSALKTIGKGAFSGCKILASFNGSANLETIGANAFAKCAKLASFTVPASVTTIGDGAFSECTALTLSFEDGASPAIGNDAFKNVKTLDMPTDENGFMAIGTTIFGYSGEATEITVPEKYNAIDKSAFEGNTSITKVTFENSAITIGDFAFKGCTALSTVELPAHAEFGNSVFEGCTALKEVTIPDEWTEIVFGTFAKSGVETVNFGTDSKLTTIGEYAFYNCESLTSFAPPASIVTIDSAAFALSGLQSINWTLSNLQTIGDGTFAGLTLSSVNIETATDKTFTIGKTANSDRTSASTLKSTLDKGYTALKSSGNAAGVFTWTEFGGDVVISAPNAQELRFGEGTVNHGNAFAYTTVKTGCEFTITLKVKAGGKFAMAGGKSFYKSYVSAVNFPEEAVTTSTTNYLGSSAFEYAYNLKEIYIPAYLSNLSKYKFANSPKLEKVVIGNGVDELVTTAMTSGMFCNCTALTSVIINQKPDGGIVKVGSTVTATSTSNCFGGIYSNVVVYVNADLLDSYKADTNWAKHVGAGLNIQAIPTSTDKTETEE